MKSRGKLSFIILPISRRVDIKTKKQNENILETTGCLLT